METLFEIVRTIRAETIACHVLRLSEDRPDARHFCRAYRKWA